MINKVSRSTWLLRVPFVAVLCVRLFIDHPSTSLSLCLCLFLLPVEVLLPTNNLFKKMAARVQVYSSKTGNSTPDYVETTSNDLARINIIEKK